MSDFAVGDVVVCVDARAAYGWHSGSLAVPLAEGRCYRVVAVDYTRDSAGSYGVSVEGIVLSETPDFSPYFQSFRFRKLPKADEQFTAQMRACKPVRVGV